MAAKTETLPDIGIVSIGEMGLGVAKLLQHHGYTVLTTVEGRSERTAARVTSAGIVALPSDVELVHKADYILSIVPPRDAFATAQRISTALKTTPSSSQPGRPTPLHYLDLNAISPAQARKIAAVFFDSTSSPGISTSSSTTTRKTIFIDGGIIGGPPSPPTSSPSDPWSRPSIPLSGPTTSLHPSFLTVLNAHQLGPDIGTASGLKMCFASLTKGFQALATQSFSTAAALGVLDELKAQLAKTSPKTLELAGGITRMPPKAYRWVAEMREIGETFEVDGGWGPEERVFGGVAGVYAVVADDTVLGEETTEVRKRGRTVEDVAAAVAEGLADRRAKKRKV